jgi:hypothetical protein
MSAADHLITVLADDRSSHHGRLLVPTGALPRLPHHGRRWPPALEWHRGAAVTAHISALLCRSCRPNVPFAELVCLSKVSLAEEYYAERSGNR